MLIYQRFGHYRKVFKTQKMPQAGILNLDLTNRQHEHGAKNESETLAF